MSFGGGCRSVDHSVLTANFNLRPHELYQAIYDFLMLRAAGAAGARARCQSGEAAVVSLQTN